MERVVVAGPRRLAPALLARLQEAGALQLEPVQSAGLASYELTAGERRLLERWEAVAQAAEHSLFVLGMPDETSELFGGTLDDAERVGGAWAERASALDAERERLREERELIAVLEDILGALAALAHGLDESAWLSVLPFLLLQGEDLGRLRSALQDALDDRVVLASRLVGGRLAVVAVVMAREAEEARAALSRAGVSELPRGPYTHATLAEASRRVAERVRLAPGELARVREGLDDLAREAGPTLPSLLARARDELGRLAALGSLVSGRYGFALSGWVPAKRAEAVAQALAHFEDELEHDSAPAEEEADPGRVPVLLDNPPWRRPFEGLISFLNTPRYDGWDPTWVIALLFPLWVGMVVGDIGYAAVYGAFTVWLWGYARRGETLVVEFFGLRLRPERVAQTVRIILPAVLWTAVWGFIYGECFGDLLRRLGIFAAPGKHGGLPVLIDRLDTRTTATMLILVSVGFGSIQVLHGFYLKAMLAWRRRDMHAFAEGIGYFGGVEALVFFAYAFMTKSYGLAVMVPAAAGFLVFGVGVIWARALLMVAELPTQGGHILSYIRIYAVGLASAILAELATAVGFDFYRWLGVGGIVLGVLAAALGHAFLLALLTLGHVLQPIRLIWVEFFTKFDFYTDSGPPYRPFRSVRQTRAALPSGERGTP